MASLFKRGKGKHVPYTIQYVDHAGVRRTCKGFTDKGLTEQLAAKLETESRLRQTGLVDIDQEQFAAIKQSSIELHVHAFEESLSERTRKYVQHTIGRLRRVLVGAGITTLSGLSAEAVTVFLRKLRRTENLGPRTYNHYLQALDAFCNWSVLTKRLVANPLVGIVRLNVAVDVRHKRRALSTDEFQGLIQAARASDISIQCFTGEQRARIYLMSYLTGIRQKELGSLTPRSFSLRSNPPTVVIEAATSKHRKRDILPLHPQLAEVLPEWLSGLKPHEKLFPGFERKKAWIMVKRDLEAANIPYENEEGIADFHAAGRHTHITELLRNGATLPEAQKLARHSDINMTMRYTHIGIADQAKALANLPVSALHGRCISGGARGLPLSSADIADLKEKRLNPYFQGISDAHCHQVSLNDPVEAAGIWYQKSKVATELYASHVMACSCVMDFVAILRHRKHALSENLPPLNQKCLRHRTRLLLA